jgi:hypothetical protein
MAVAGGTYSTPGGKSLSHITFYDSVCVGPECDPNTEVPLPAAAWLLLSGLAGLGVVSRRRKTA